MYLEGVKPVAHPHTYNDLELEELLVRPVDVKAGFVLEDPSDPRYQQVVAHRTRFGRIIHRAADALRQKQEGEDHIDAVIAVSKAIDVYLLEYAMTRTAFDALQKTYAITREYVLSSTTSSRFLSPLAASIKCGPDKGRTRVKSS